jgi:hypothetical protein
MTAGVKRRPLNPPSRSTAITPDRRCLTAFYLSQAPPDALQQNRVDRDVCIQGPEASIGDISQIPIERSYILPNASDRLFESDEDPQVTGFPKPVDDPLQCESGFPGAASSDDSR